MTVVNGVDMDHCVTVEGLINVLKECDPQSYVIMSSDSEGNSFSPFAEAGTAIYRPEKTWWGETVHPKDIEDGYDEALCILGENLSGLPNPDEQFPGMLHALKVLTEERGRYTSLDDEVIEQPVSCGDPECCGEPDPS